MSSNKLTYLDFNEAVKRSLDLAQTVTLSQLVPLSNALNKIIAKDVKCVKNLPSFDNSAMDGFAFNLDDNTKEFKVIRTIFAGDKADKVKASLKKGECYRIMTGAQVPSDANTIIPIENCLEANSEFIKVPENLKKGSNLRLKGEEQKQGDVLFRKGETINSSMITLFASQGLTMIEVYKEISIAVVSTGNELKEPWEDSSDDEIYNCNSYALISLLQEKGFNASYCGVVPDNLEDSIQFIENLKSYDVIITSGGISLGDADFMAEAFERNALKTAFHGVNVKPGRPIMMGKMNNTIVMCLPGNPLTAMVNMRLFALPVLNKLQGANNYFHGTISASSETSFKTKEGRVNVVLGKHENGNFKVTRNNKYGSGMITALYESNSILVTSEKTGKIDEKQKVLLIDFAGITQEKQTNIFN